MKYVKEIMWIIAFTFLGELLNTLLPLPVPAGVYGMILLLIALVTGIVKLPGVVSRKKQLAPQIMMALQ